jgi:hypothetical protein
MTALWKERTTRDHIAKELHIPAFELDNLLFGLASDQSMRVPETVMVQQALRLVARFSQIEG